MKTLFLGILISVLLISNDAMAQLISKDQLSTLVRKSVDNKKVFGAIIQVSTNEQSLKESSGNLSYAQPYFIASTTKLYVTACVLQLRFQGKLALTDKIANYLDTSTMRGLHIYKGKDYSQEISIQQLMAHTSGLPDYFQQKNPEGITIIGELAKGRDRKWSFEEAVSLSKTMPPQFAPGTKSKAFYSDINYQLLGRILENICHKPLEQIFSEFIYTPLGLTQTYLYANLNDTAPALMYYDSQKLNIPKAMSSVWADGGIVSTADESMVFLKAFFQGKLFPKEYIQEIQQWNKIFFPLEYGIGIAKFGLPSFYTLFKKVPAVIGHSGLSGAFDYYCPEKDIYIVGTVNQINKPSLSYKLLVQILMQCK